MEVHLVAPPNKMTTNTCSPPAAPTEGAEESALQAIADEIVATHNRCFLASESMSVTGSTINCDLCPQSTKRVLQANTRGSVASYWKSHVLTNAHKDAYDHVHARLGFYEPTNAPTEETKLRRVLGAMEFQHVNENTSIVRQDNGKVGLQCDACDVVVTCNSAVPCARNASAHVQKCKNNHTRSKAKQGNRTPETKSGKRSQAEVGFRTPEAKSGKRSKTEVGASKDNNNPSGKRSCKRSTTPKGILSHFSPSPPPKQSSSSTDKPINAYKDPPAYQQTAQGSVSSSSSSSSSNSSGSSSSSGSGSSSSCGSSSSSGSSSSKECTDSNEEGETVTDKPGTTD